MSSKFSILCCQLIYCVPGPLLPLRYGSKAHVDRREEGNILYFYPQICMQLGWKAPKGRFDVLPLLLQANGNDPELFEISEDLVLEVPIIHPKFGWFKDLDLKWYGLPAVSNMLMDIGGLEFTGCPFSGWYMGTEIGVRDFCDSSRYNILEEVADKMGLDTRKTSSLWKDQALVEINIAVLYSFQTCKVTIVDHHSATESFMKHMENEYRVRGGCPGDWVWIVPPMSGSITPVFHQEMLNYHLTPSFEYQVMCMDEYDVVDLEHETLVLAVTSTFGATRFDLTACPLTPTLESPPVMNQRSGSILRAQDLLPMSVFGLGSRAYPHFCAFAHAVDTLFEELGGERILRMGEGDELCGQEESFRTWAKKAACDVFCVGDDVNIEKANDSLISNDRSWKKSKFRLTYTAEAPLLTEGIIMWEQSYELLRKKKVYGAKMIEAQNLQSSKSNRSTILVRLDTNNHDSLRYKPGDHLGIFPGNHEDLVTALIDKLEDAPPVNQIVRVEFLEERNTALGVISNWTHETRIPPCTIYQAFQCFLDITTPPTPVLLQQFAALATNDKQKRKLEILSGKAQASKTHSCGYHRHLNGHHGLQEYEEWKWYNNPTLVEVLDEFPSIQMPSTLLLTQLPLLQPRYYSISSSPDLYQGEIHLTVAVVSYRTRESIAYIEENKKDSDE
ncbi:Nitric oxide synthase, brain [Goodea atripinnis]|uniref:nitric-oxide synthase (NADPH) n=1 Tax=Goodea atripinnis TaxID=208336 RepID=A0ABV0P0G7_9TELE